MSTANQGSRTFVGRARLLASAVALLLVIFMLGEPARAQSKVCVRTVLNNLALNGIVANSTAGGGGCAPGPVWPNIAPVEYQPGGGSPNAYLYTAYNPGTHHLFIGVDLKGDTDLSDQDILFVIFDANNNKVFDAGDFFIKVTVWNKPPIATGNTGGEPGAACNRPTVQDPVLPVEVGQFMMGSGWQIVGDSAVAAAVKTKMAYDYETAVDAEHDIWNVEIDMPVGQVINGTTYFNLQTAAPFFGIGSYVFMDTGHHDGVANPQTGTVLKWPSSMVDRTITQQNLFGIPATTADQLGEASLTQTCFDVNWSAANPWVINGAVAAEHDSRINRNGDNIFRVTLYYAGPAGAVGTLPNPGTVRLALTPYRASGAGTAWSKTQAVNLSDYNKTYTFEFHFDFSSPDPSFGSAANVNFVCASTTLEGFAHDDDKTNDLLYVNHNNFTTSDYASDFFVFGDAVPNLKPGESTTVLLRLESANDPAGDTKPTAANRTSPTVIAMLGSAAARRIALGLFAFTLIGLTLLPKLRAKPRLKRFAGALTLLLILPVAFSVACNACKRKPPPPPPIGTSRWQIKNADDLGIKPVEGEPGLYEMPIRYGEAKRVQLDFQGVQLPYTTEQHSFNPVGPSGANNILPVAVKPGQVVSVLAFGAVDLDGPDGPLAPTSATGMIVPATATPAQSPYVLRAGYYSPNEYAGALIGSFDNFETSFVVGRAASIRVPDNASTLSLSVNGRRGEFARMSGALDIYTIFTTAPSNPTHTAIQGDATFHIPPHYELWDVLTSLNVYTYYVTTDTDGNGRVRSQTRNIWGSAHMTIFDSHVGGTR